MMDLKILNSALDQLESERGIPKEKILEAVSDALAAAYKKDYGKRGQIIRADFDPATGTVEFSQVKTVVDESTVRMPEEEDETEEESASEAPVSTDTSGEEAEEGKRVRFNPEHHILLEDARKIKRDAELGEEVVFPLEAKDDYGRIAAQTAKQVIIQRIREAERSSVSDEFEKRQGEIVSGTVQRMERGNVYVDLGRVTGIIPRDEQIPGERYKPGERIRAYLYSLDESGREISLRLSRTHPRFLLKLFELEVPEIVSGTVEVRAIAREPGARSKLAVLATDQNIDPVGSLVGQRGVRVATVTNELNGEKIDIIEWAEDPHEFIQNALSPAEIASVELDEESRRATVEVAPEQYSLAIGKGGQNARLAARLTGWRIDIRETSGEGQLEVDEEGSKVAETEPEPEAAALQEEDIADPEEASPETKTGAEQEAEQKNEEAGQNENAEENR